MVKYHKADGTETLKTAYTYGIVSNVTAVDCAGTGSELTGLTFEYDNSRIRNGKNAYTYTRTLAKKAMITAGKGWRKSGIDKKNERNIGKPLYYHYHPKVKNGAHMWYGMPKVYEK